MALTERWKDSTVPSVLASRGTSDAGAPFVLFEDEVVTFGQVESRAEALAASLHNLGVERGDRIAVVLPACPEFLVAVFAAAKLGAVLVPMNPRLTVPEVRYMLRHSEAVAAVTVERYHGTDFLHLFEELFVPEERGQRRVRRAPAVGSNRPVARPGHFAPRARRVIMLFMVSEPTLLMLPDTPLVFS